MSPTYWTFRVGLYNTAKVCDGLFCKPFLPIQHVPATKWLSIIIKLFCKHKQNISISCIWNLWTKCSVLAVCVYCTVSLIKSYRGKSAMSLTSAITSLWSNTMCLRSWSFSEEGKESEHSTQVTGSPPLKEDRQVLALRCSGKQSGSRIQSWSPDNEKTL